MIIFVIQESTKKYKPFGAIEFKIFLLGGGYNFSSRPPPRELFKKMGDGGGRNTNNFINGSI